MQGGYEKNQFLTNISLYLRNDTTYGHSYYGMRIGNCTQAFEWYIFNKSFIVYRMAPFSTTMNDFYPQFQVTPLFDAEYLTNSMRYSFSGIIIGTYTHPSQGCHIERP